MQLSAGSQVLDSSGTQDRGRFLPPEESWGILRTEHSLVGAPFLLLLVPPMPLVLIDPPARNSYISASFCQLRAKSGAFSLHLLSLGPHCLTPSGRIMVGDTSWEVQNRVLTQLEMEKC